MSDEALEHVDIEEVLLRLTVYAFRLFNAVREPRVDPVLKGGEGGESPEDLAMGVVLRFLNPEDHSVQWDTAKGGDVTTRSLLALLRTVLYRDFIDLKRKGRYRRCDYLSSAGSADDACGDSENEMTLDDFASALEPPDLAAIRREQRDRMITYFKRWPELLEIVELQVEAADSYKLTNQDLAIALDTTVADVENRKKRIQRHSMAAALFAFGPRAKPQAPHAE